MFADAVPANSTHMQSRRAGARRFTMANRRVIDVGIRRASVMPERRARGVQSGHFVEGVTQLGKRAEQASGNAACGVRPGVLLLAEQVRRSATHMDVGNTRSSREHDWCGPRREATSTLVALVLI